MEPFDVAQSFVEHSTRGEPAQALASIFQTTIQRLGFRYFACCSHIDLLRPPPGAVMLHNYPADWANEFCERKLHQFDPVLLHAERSFLPFHWDAPEFLTQTTGSQQAILAQAARFGVARGYTIPIHMPWTPDAMRASCSVVPDSNAIGASSYFVIQLMAMHLYHAARRQDRAQFFESLQHVLSPRERQCLEFVAQGKSDWAIGQILNISEHTVHRYIEMAKRRLGVTTRVQAIIRALQGHQISLGDVIQADARNHTVKH